MIQADFIGFNLGQIKQDTVITIRSASLHRGHLGKLPDDPLRPAPVPHALGRHKKGQKPASCHKGDQLICIKK